MSCTAATHTLNSFFSVSNSVVPSARQDGK